MVTQKGKKYVVWPDVKEPNGYGDLEGKNIGVSTLLLS